MSSIVLTLALSAAVQVGSTGPGVTTVPRPVTVPMDLELVRPCVEIMINGKGPYRFLVDTGASPQMVINGDLVSELGLATEPGDRIGDPSNPEAIPTRRVAIDQVKIGDAVFDNVEAASWDRTELFSGDDAPRGIVGFALFRDVLLTLDFPRERLVIENGALPTADGRSILEYEAGDGIPSVPITVGGKTFHAHLDSGSMGAVMLPLSSAKQLPLKSEPVVIGQGRTVNSSFDILTASLDGEVVFGPHTVKDPDLYFNDQFEHANVGSKLFSDYSFTIDQSNRRIRIEPRSDGKRATPRTKRGSYGVGFNPQAQPPVVMRVVEGSVAEQAGLKLGDVIIEVNGSPVGDQRAGDLAKAFRSDSIILLVERDGERREVTMAHD